MPFYKSDDVLKVLKDDMVELQNQIELNKNKEGYSVELISKHEEVKRCWIFVNRDSRLLGVVHSEYLKDFHHLPVETYRKLTNLEHVESVEKVKESEESEQFIPELSELNKFRDDFEMVRTQKQSFIGKNVHVVSITDRLTGTVCAFGVELGTGIDNIISNMHKGVVISLKYNKINDIHQTYISILKSYYIGNLFNEYTITINDVFDISKQEQNDSMYKLIKELTTDNL